MYAIQKTTKSGTVSIIIGGLTKEKADRLAVMSAYADFDGSTYTVIPE
jgi:hypothetical protein